MGYTAAARGVQCDAAGAFRGSGRVSARAAEQVGMAMARERGLKAAHQARVAVAEIGGLGEFLAVPDAYERKPRPRLPQRNPLVRNRF